MFIESSCEKAVAFNIFKTQNFMRQRFAGEILGSHGDDFFVDRRRHGNTEDMILHRKTRRNEY
jgi:hypothetical protein